MSETIAEPTGAVGARRWFALFVVLSAQLMVVLDTTVVNVALPAVQRDLDVSQADLTWVINGYLVSYGSLLLVAGRLGDLVGRKKVFLVGIAVFTAASVACALAGSAAVLVVARFAQGVGGAFASAAVLALIVVEFPQPRERGRAMSLYILVSVGGGSLGLLLGGLLTQVLDWHWIFAVNVPIGILALAAGAWLLEDQPGLGLGRGIDLTGAVLVTAALLVGIDAIVQASDAGWVSTRTLGLGTISAMLLVAFVVRESRAANPIMPLRIFRLRSLVASSVVRATVTSGMYGMFFFGTLHLQQVLGYSALDTGFAFLPQTLAVTALSFGITTRLVGRFGPKPVIVAGMLLMVAGLLIQVSGDEDAGYFPAIFVSFVLVGLGSGAAFVPLLTTAMADVQPYDAGLASGIVNVSMQVSGAVALAVLGTLSTNRTDALLSDGRTPLAALAGGNDLGLLVAAGCVAAAVLLAVALLRNPVPAPRAVSPNKREKAPVG